MAAASLVVNIATSEPRTGLWCDLCALPSGVEIDAFLLLPTGVSSIGVLRRCAECEADVS